LDERWGVGVEGMVTRRENWWSPRITYKRSRYVFAFTAIALTLVRHGIELLQLPAQSLIGRTPHRGDGSKPWLYNSLVQKNRCWGEGTGTRPYYLANRADKKIEAPLGIAWKSRNSLTARGGEVGAEGMLTKGTILCSPGTKHERSKNAFLSNLLRSPWQPLAPNCWRYLHSS